MKGLRGLWDHGPSVKLKRWLSEEALSKRLAILSGQGYYYAESPAGVKVIGLIGVPSHRAIATDYVWTYVALLLKGEGILQVEDIFTSLAVKFLESQQSQIKPLILASHSR